MQKLLKQAGFAEPHSSSTIGLVRLGLWLGCGWVGLGWGWDTNFYPHPMKTGCSIAILILGRAWQKNGAELGYTLVQMSC